MGFLRRLLDLDSPPDGPAHSRPRRQAVQEVDWRRFDDHMRLKVFGESFYQEALAEISSAPPKGEHRFECMACLVPEPTNPHDRFAVRVEIDGRHVGYLPRGSAKRFHRRLAAMIEAGRPTMCVAFVGRRESENPNLGVSLRIPYDGDLLNGNCADVS